MRKMKALVLLLSLCGLTAACSSKEDTFVGNWVGRTGTLEFAKDKTGSITPAPGRPDLPARVPMTWTVESSDEVRITLPNGSGKPTIGKLTEKNVLLVEGDKFVKQ